MIYGIGVDTTSISRIEKSMKRDGFLIKFFGSDERALFEMKNLRSQTIAANFAAKEALSKALGTGLGGFAFAQAQILRRDSGQPYFKFSGELFGIMADNMVTAQVSLTHEADLATAFVVLERTENQ